MPRRSGKLIAANVLSYVMMIVVNGLANALPIAGRTTGEISDAYPNLFTPAGFTFGIWGAIYLLLGFFILRQVEYFIRRREMLIEVERIGWLFVFSSLMNAFWIVAWHYLWITFSFAIMLLLLFSLILIYLRLRGGRLAGRRVTSFLDFWTLHAPFRLYLGWITAATLANLTILLVHRGFDAISTPGMFWAIGMIFLAMMIGLIILILKRDVVYAVVLLWTFIGILVKRVTSPELVIPVIVMASIGIVMLLYGVLRVKLTTE
jgi:translocator protein